MAKVRTVILSEAALKWMQENNPTLVEQLGLARQEYRATTKRTAATYWSRQDTDKLLAAEAKHKAMLVEIQTALAGRGVTA